MKNCICGQVLLGVCLFLTRMAYGQSEGQLADEYFKNGEYEKAAVEYGKQVSKSGTDAEVSWELANRYVTSLRKSKKPDEAEKQLKRWVKAPGNIGTYANLLLGSGYQQTGDTLRAKKAFEESYTRAGKDAAQVGRLGELFAEIGSTEWAIVAFKRSQELSKDRAYYALELAASYRAKGNTKSWIESLLPLADRPDQRTVMQGLLQTTLGTNDEKLLEAVLYEQLQQYPESVANNELLSWYFVQKQKFARALIQEKAMDKRLKLSGAKILELASLAMANREYKTAIDAYEYIIQNYQQGTFYPYVRRMVINAREEQLKNTFPIDPESIRTLIREYNRVLAEVGNTPKTLDALRSSANLYAYYLDEKDSALLALDRAINLGKNDSFFVDKCKLEKGDVYLLKDEPWEATLLYSQVEKSQKDDLLGYEAKLKNARLYYYRGDFTVAKSLLDVLKLATTREIANDAEQLSMLILDNTGLDSTELAMRSYSALDLLIFQNKFDAALTGIDVFLKKYEKHTLMDEVIWLRSKIYLKQNKLDAALNDLNQIVTKYPLDILGDDALYTLAKLTDEKVANKEQALALYQRFLTEYPGSLFAAEARKRLRKLRGDVVN